MTEQASADGPAQGWYTDPYDPSRLRWWDGAAWTDHVHPPAGAAPAEAAAGSTAATEPAAATQPATQAGGSAGAEPASGGIVTSAAPGGAGGIVTSADPGDAGGVVSSSASATKERGAIAKWFSSGSNIALLAILVIAIVLFVLVMSGALT